MENSLAASGSSPVKLLTKRHPEGIEPDQIFFHEAEIHDLILAYQRDPTPEIWQAIVIGSLPLIDSLIRKHSFQLYDDQDALRSECVLKLHKAIQHYNPARGRAFSVLSVALFRFLISHVQMIRTRGKRISFIEDKILEQYPAKGQTRTELPAEIKARLGTIQTRFKSKSDRAAVKLFIN
jgi:DNA-directed RNA polymerase specialized sigma subunit